MCICEVCGVVFVICLMFIFGVWCIVCDVFDVCGVWCSVCDVFVLCDCGVWCCV